MRKIFLILGGVAAFIGAGALACGLSGGAGVEVPTAGAIATGAGVTLLGAGFCKS